MVSPELEGAAREPPTASGATTANVETSGLHVPSEHEDGEACRADQPRQAPLARPKPLSTAEQYMGCPCSNHNSEGIALTSSDRAALEELITESNQRIQALAKYCVKANQEWVEDKFSLGDYLQEADAKTHPEWAKPGVWFNSYHKKGVGTFLVVTRPGENAALDVAFDDAWEEVVSARGAVSAFIAARRRE